MARIEEALAEHQERERPFQNQYLSRVDSARLGTVEYKVGPEQTGRAGRERLTQKTKLEMDNWLAEGGKTILFEKKKKCSKRCV